MCLMELFIFYIILKVCSTILFLQVAGEMDLFQPHRCKRSRLEGRPGQRQTATYHFQELFKITRNLAAPRPPGNTSSSHLMMLGCETKGFGEGKIRLSSCLSQGKPICPDVTD